MFMCSGLDSCMLLILSVMGLKRLMDLFVLLIIILLKWMVSNIKFFILLL